MTYLAAAIQVSAGPDKGANLERAERLVRLAAARGADLVALPEVFNWRGRRADEPAASESLAGESLARMAGVARDLPIPLVAGSKTPPAARQPAQYKNSNPVGPGGIPPGLYAKTQCF